MEFGYLNNRFYIDVPSCRWEIKDFRTEVYRRAVNLYEQNNKLMLGMSTGLDSQIVLLSCLDQGIPIECVFMYLPGYNDFEMGNISMVEKRFGIKVQILDFDPYELKNDLIEESEETKIHPNQLLHKKFLSLLPEDALFLQGIDGPCVVPAKGRFFYFESYNSFEVSRYRAFKLLNRSGGNEIFDKESEVLLSILNDDTYKGFLYTFNYFDNNKLRKDKAFLTTIDRWDYYIKPIIYGKYFRDELLYFAKYDTSQAIPYLVDTPHKWREHGISIPYELFLEHLKSCNGETKRFYENTVIGEKIS